MARRTVRASLVTTSGTTAKAGKHRLSRRSFVRNTAGPQANVTLEATHSNFGPSISQANFNCALTPQKQYSVWLQLSLPNSPKHLKTWSPFELEASSRQKQDNWHKGHRLKAPYGSAPATHLKIPKLGGSGGSSAPPPPPASIPAPSRPGQ